MKRADLEAGIPYALKHWRWQPHVLLSTDVHEELIATRGGVSYKPAPEQKPGRDARTWGDRRNYGYLALGGEPEVLASIDLAAHLAALVAGTLDPDSVPDGVSLKFITSLAQIEGPYGDVTAKRDAEQARYKAARAREADAWNEIARAFNAVMDDKLPLAEGAAPRNVNLTLEQAMQIADAPKAEIKEA